MGLVGQGGMDRVFEAFDDELRQRVAIKVISEPSPLLASLMRPERTVHAALQHPGIVSVYDSGETPHKPDAPAKEDQPPSLARQACVRRRR
jgi:serine/threonine-protein kinase